MASMKAQCEISRKSMWHEKLCGGSGGGSVNKRLAWRS